MLVRVCWWWGGRLTAGQRNSLPLDAAAQQTLLDCWWEGEGGEGGEGERGEGGEGEGKTEVGG